MPVQVKQTAQEIQTFTIVGLGALGTLFGHILEEHMPKADLRVLADPVRVARYRRDNVYSNGVPCNFQYVTTEDKASPADLLLVAVKATQLKDALQTMRGHVGPHTLILSLLNGISSEEIIAAEYGREKVVDCIAYGMDAVKKGNRLTYSQTGKLCIGTHISGPPTGPVQKIARFFERTSCPYEVSETMGKVMWGKLMLNVGVNQTVAVFGPDYSAILKSGEQRDIMIAAMREVIELSKFEGVNLTEDDLQGWLDVLDTMHPSNKPSMRQDVEAKRPSEVMLFSGTVLALGEKYGVDTPVNRMLYGRILQIESKYPA